MSKYDIGKIYNIAEKRPKVLLLGNGPVITNGNAISWSKLIEKLDKDKSKASLEKTIPYSLRATIAAPCDDQIRREAYATIFGQEYKYTSNEILKSLLLLPWDAVLTTNYTYDLEYVLQPQFVNIKNKVSSNYVFETNKSRKSGYGTILLRNFNRFYVDDNNYKDIWHIHGEIRNKSSIVLTHEEYARQIKAIITYNMERGNEYSNYSSELRFKSWLDYLILGDVYIVGLGMDFTEFDLWWILNRRMREKTGCGNLYYFNPNESRDDIYSVIRAMNGQCFDMGIRIEPTDNCELQLKEKIKKENNRRYKEFYKKLILDLSGKL